MSEEEEEREEEEGLEGKAGRRNRGGKQAGTGGGVRQRGVQDKGTRKEVE